MTDNTNRTAKKSKSELLGELRIVIEYLADELATVCAARDQSRAARDQWEKVSQTNYQRAKAAESKLSKARLVLGTIESTSDQPSIVALAHDTLTELAAQ